MSDIITTNGVAVEIWADPESIREQFGAGLTAKEFGFFMGLGQHLGANPFTREIWAVKYGNNPAQIFLGRDFYRRKAQEQAEYNGHVASAVYENDDFAMINGQPSHKYNIKNRGHLIGAYCVVYKKNAEVPYTVFVELREYTTGQSNWKTKPATMIAKVAEAQALRGAFSGVFNGTYSEDEQASVETNKKHSVSARKSVGDILGDSHEDIAVQGKYDADEAVIVDETIGELFDDSPQMATPEQMEFITINANFLAKKRQDWLIQTGDAVTNEQAQGLIDQIKANQAKQGEAKQAEANP
jgi:phage recombination protein Bet